MRAILAALVHLAKSTGRFTVAEATRFYHRLWQAIGLTLLACFAAFMINAMFGVKGFSLALAIVFAIIAIFLWAKPLNILIVAGFGLAERIVADVTLAGEVERALKLYLDFLKTILLVGVTFLFITGTVSFTKNPGAILPILVALGVIGLFTWKWPALFVGTWGRRLVYGYAVIIIAVSFGSLIPGAVWTKYTGWDPLTAKPTNTEEALYRLNQKRRELDDADRAGELERITGKVIRREALTQAEEHFIAEAKRSQSSEKSAAQQQQQMRLQRVEVPLASAPQSTWPKLVMSAGGKSDMIPVPVGMKTVMVGDRFVLHTVYVDGRDCSFEESGPCPAGAYAGIYARNKASETNTVLYAFAPM